MLQLCTKRPWRIVCNGGKIDYHLSVLINEVVCIFTVEYNAAIKINEVENENDYMK